MSVTSNNLVTIHTFKDQEYLIRFNQSANIMELEVLDKQVGEEWRCNFDSNYLENLTSKTGNFKTFEVFIKMLKSGLMKTSRAITLSLLTYEELHNNQTPNIKPYFRRNDNEANENKRYLILSYITEFDKTFYPLTMEYRGLPDVKSLIATIRRLETELTKTREEFASFKIHHRSIKRSDIEEMQKRINELSIENVKLSSEKLQKSKHSAKHELAKTSSLENALLKLEKSVIIERKNHQQYIVKVEQEKKKMKQEIDTLRRSESALKQRLNQSKKSSGVSSFSGAQSTIPRRGMQKNSPTSSAPKKVPSRASSRCSRTSSGCESINSRSTSYSNRKTLHNTTRKCSAHSSSQSHTSSHARSDMIKLKLANSQHDYSVIEQRINELQKKLLTKPQNNRK